MVDIVTECVCVGGVTILRGCKSFIIVEGKATWSYLMGHLYGIWIDKWAIHYLVRVNS